MSPRFVLARTCVLLAPALVTACWDWSKTSSAPDSGSRDADVSPSDGGPTQPGPDGGPTPDGEVPPGPDASQGDGPALTIDFPPSGLTDALTVTASGSVAVDGETPTVEVNGAPVFVAADGAWTTEVTLELGANRIDVRARSADGAETNAHVEVERAVLWSRLGDLVGGATKLVALDRGTNSLFTVDRQTGAREVLASASVGGGVSLEGADALARSAQGNLVAQVDKNVVAINEATGARSVLSALSSQPRVFDYDTTRGYFVYIDEPLYCVSIDPTTGNTNFLDMFALSVVDVTYPFGPDWSYILEGNDAGGFDVRRLNGCSRESVVSTGRGSAPSPGPALLDATAIAIGSSSTLYAVDRGRAALLSIDVSTGTRAIVSDGSVGTGARLDMPEKLIVDTNEVFLTDPGLNAIVRVDPANGNRAMVSRVHRGEGPAVRQPNAMTMLAHDAFVIDTDRFGVIGIDLATGDRRIVSSSDVGTGDVFSMPTDIEAEASGRALYVLDAAVQGVIRVDVATGNRTILTGRDVGAGPSLGLVRAMTFDRKNQRLIVVQGDSLFGVSTERGDRLIVSSPSLGEGPTLAPIDLAWDETRNRVVVINQTEPRILEVDLATGDRRALVTASETLGSPTRITVRGGEIFLADGAQGLLAVDDAGAVRHVAPLVGTDAGPDLGGPAGFGSGPAAPVYFWRDNRLIAVHPRAGDRVIVAR